MINIESRVYSPIYTALITQFNGIYVTSEPASVSSKNLAASIVQIDNYSSVGKQDNTLEERFATVTFQVDVYSNLQTGKKSKCYEVMEVIDNMLFKMNFMRIMTNPVPMEDSGYYKLTARYRAETDGINLYRI